MYIYEYSTNKKTIYFMTSIEIDYTAINTVCAEKRPLYYGIYAYMNI